MFDVHIHSVNVSADTKNLEKRIMASLNDLLARLDASDAKAEAERAQVTEAVTGLKAEVAELREIIANQPLPEVDLSPAFAKLDVIDAKIDAIYTPDAPAPEPTPEPSPE